MNLPPSILNPFSDSVCRTPWEPPPPTVPAINEHVFLRCLDLLRQAAGAKQTTSFFVDGAPGSGKTHLLARLRAELVNKPIESLGLAHRPVFCWVRFESPSGGLWYFIRQCLFRDLLKPVSGSLTQLDLILRTRLPELGAQTDQGFFEYWTSGWFSTKHKQLQEQVIDLCERCEIDRELRQVLLHLHGEHRVIARDWLRGSTALLPADVKNLGLNADPSAKGLAEPESQKLVMSLCRLLGPEIPLVLCVDQIEGLLVGTGDPLILGKFADLMGQLHDQSGSTKLLISFILSHTHEALMDAAKTESLRSRLAKHRASLAATLLWGEARSLTAHRLRVNSALSELANGHPPLWPLDEARLQLRHKENAHVCSARRWIEICEREFDEAIKPPPPLDLSQKFHNKRQGAGPISEEAFHRACLKGLPLLARLQRPAWREIMTALAQPLHPESAVLFESTPDRRRLGARWFLRHPAWQTLDSIAEKWQQASLPGLVLIFRESEATLSKPLRGRLSKLRQDDAVTCFPTHEQVRALDVLAGLVAEASTAQGLRHDGRVVTTQEVLKWAEADFQSPLPTALAPLKELAEDIFGKSGGGGEPLHLELLPVGK